MSAIFNLLTNSLGIKSSYQKLLTQILQSKYQLKAKHEPIELKKILTDNHAKSFFINQLSSPAIISLLKIPQAQLTNILILILKKLSVFHHLTIHYPNFANLIEKIQLEQLLKNIPENEWLLVNVLRPYVWFIKKYCLSVEMYLKLRLMPNGSRDNIFEAMCYSVNLFKSLFGTVAKLSSIGRYFREVYAKQVDYFVQLMAYHSQLIYQSFRSCLIEIISFSQQHLSKPQYESMFKKILLEDLALINEEMKKLFLDKYFYPYGKGYGVKLYRIEDQNQYQIKVINGILSDHLQTERKKNIKMMEEIVFPKSKLKKGMSCDQLEVSFTLGLQKLHHLKKPSNHNLLNKTLNSFERRDNNRNKLNSLQYIDSNQLDGKGVNPQKDWHENINTNYTLGMKGYSMNSEWLVQSGMPKVKDKYGQGDVSIEERCQKISCSIKDLDGGCFEEEVVEEV